MLQKTTIKMRLLVGFGLILVMMIVATFISVTGLNKANKEFLYFIEHPAKAYADVQACRVETNIAARLIREMFINPDKNTYGDYEAKINTSVSSLKANLDSLELSYGTADGKVAAYKTLIYGWVDIGMRAVAEIKKGTVESERVAREILLKECSPALEQAVEAAGVLSTTSTDIQIFQEQKNIQDTQNNSLLAFSILLLSVVLGVIISSRVTKSIVRPLAEVEIAASEMAKGNLGAKIAYQSKDAVGKVADSMRESMSTLACYISDIDKAMTSMSAGNFNVGASQPFVGDFKHIEQSISSFIVNMSETLSQIRGSSIQVEGGSTQVSSASQQLSQGASEQASSIELLSENVEEISRQVRENASNALEANRITTQVSQEMETSNNQMQQMMAAMEEINHSSQEIGKIIKTIEDIAFQTNILALNAAVEAARAGAAGKGFAVVADEVRNLASKSAEASKNTASLIQNSIQAVDHGTKIASETARSLQSVVAGARNVALTVDKIAQASELQAGSVEQVTQNVDEIASVVQTNSSSAEESAAASQQLADQAKVLQNLVDKFILLGGNDPAALEALKKQLTIARR